MATMLPQGKQQYFADNGDPLVGGRLFTYAAGTTTPLPTFSDSAGTIPNTNPIILDARGEATIYWQGVYDVRLEAADGSLIWTAEDVADSESLPGMLDMQGFAIINLALAPAGDNSGRAASTKFIADKSLARTLFSFFRNSVQSSGTTFVFNTPSISYHGDGSFDTVTGIFQATTAGYYSFVAEVPLRNVSGAPVSPTVTMVAGGNPVSQSMLTIANAATAIHRLNSGIVFLNPGQSAYVEINAVLSVSLFTDVNYVNKFSGWRIDTM